MKVSEAKEILDSSIKSIHEGIKLPSYTKLLYRETYAPGFTYLESVSFINVVVYVA